MSAAVQLHPLWKQAAEDALVRISEEPEAFFADEDLARQFDTPPDSDAFRFALLAWKKHLFQWHNIFFVRDRADRGYKVATASERVRVGGPQYWERFRGALLKGIQVLEGTDMTSLDTADCLSLERQLIRYGTTLLVATPVVAKRLKTCLAVEDRPSSTLEFLLDAEPK